MDHYFFPFGQELKRVQQMDTKQNKKVFVLGVYASAVHAKWLDTNGKVKVNALAVASEPSIFWRGENVEKILAGIDFPKELGKLVPADSRFNGPSGIALDQLFLEPLGLTRDEAWLCDLLPESRMNPGQKKAISNHYKDGLIDKFKLKPVTIPVFNVKEISASSEQRHLEIQAELEASGADTILLLGDLPIKWFLYFYDTRTKLSDFVDCQEAYGKRHRVVINDKGYDVIPLCHPRNAGQLGAHSGKWAEWHRSWVERMLLK